MCNLGENEGSVQKGYRPVVIVQNNYGNLYSSTTIVAPVTSRNKQVQPTHFSIQLDQESVVLCEQLQTVPISSLKPKRVYYLSGEEIAKLDVSLRASLGTL